MSTLEEKSTQDAAQHQSTDDKSVPNKENNTTEEIAQDTEAILEETADEMLKDSQESTEKPLSESQKAVEEVEKHVAEKSENQYEVPEIEMTDYQSFELEDIVKTIPKLIEEHPIQAIGKHIEALKKVFNTKFGLLYTAAKDQYNKENEANDDADDFHYDNPIQKEYNQALFEYKKKRKSYYDELDKQREANLQTKLLIIEDLKKLIEEGDASSMYNNFQNIQKSWRAVGPVSRDHYTNTWRTYHFHVERFYDLLHLRNDLRDLDFKHNLEEKTKLVIQAEALAESDNIKTSFEELQVLHRLWKEEIGPVPRADREEIWERFSEATKKIHDKKHEFYEEQNAIYEENVLKKQAVIAEIVAYDTSANKNHRDWQKSMKDIQAFRDLFFTIGKVPRSKSKKVWNSFKEATSLFNKKKNEFYKEVKKVQKENLDKKMRLVKIAESYKDSEDWNEATNTMKRIQTEWKTIGHVPRKFSDKIWNQFRSACNHYFDKLHAKDNEINEEKLAIYQNKKTYLENLQEIAQQEDISVDIKTLKTYLKEWREMGVVPKAQRYIDGKFNKFLDPYFDKLSGNKKEGTMLRYQTLIDGFIAQNDFKKITHEIQFVRNKIDTITKEKQQLENNMLFFSNADDSNPMFKNITKTLAKHESDLSDWKGKLQYLRTIEV